MTHRFQDLSWIERLFLLVLRRNCFREPEDMYSVIKISRGSFLFVASALPLPTGFPSFGAGAAEVPSLVAVVVVAVATVP